jgi:hypothetical protein
MRLDPVTHTVVVSAAFATAVAAALFAAQVLIQLWLWLG